MGGNVAVKDASAAANYGMTQQHKEIAVKPTTVRAPRYEKNSFVLPSSMYNSQADVVCIVNEEEVVVHQNQHIEAGCTLKIR